MRTMLKIVLAAFCLAVPEVRAAGELILPVGGPILRPGDATAQDPLCGAPPAFPPTARYVPPGTFEALSAALLDGSIETVTPDRDDTAQVTDDVLLRSGLHLARLRGLTEGFADRDSWRIVSLRADLCSEGGTTAPAQCTDEMRLVAQPFRVSGIYVHAPDLALHLIYRLPDAADFLGASTRLGAALRHRPAGHCTAQASAAMSDLLSRFARPERLSDIAWLTSSSSGQQWTFGRFAVGISGLVPLPTSGGGLFDNFSKPMLLSERCPLNSDAAAADRAAFRCPGTAPGNLLETIDDPLALRRPEGHCVACHSRPALDVLSDEQRINDRFGLPVFFSHSVDPANLRQFGYDHQGQPSVSDRLRLIAGAPIPLAFDTDYAGESMSAWTTLLP